MTLVILLTASLFAGCNVKKKNVSADAVTPSDQNLSLNKVMQQAMNKKVDISSIKNQHLNIAYASDSDAQKLDIFIPEGDGPFPAVILIHGGAFKAGDKAMNYQTAKELVANGYVAIPINYRLSGEAIFPAAVHDCKAAIRYIRANSKKYNVEPDNIASMGASAGGYFTAMMGTSAGNKYIDGNVGDYAHIPSDIKAAVNWFGPINFSTMVPEAKALGMDEGYNVDNETQFLGVDANDPANAAIVTRANPTTYIDANAPPFFIQVGSEDPLIPYTQSFNFYKALKKVKGVEQVNYELIKGAGHGGPQFHTDSNLGKVVGFFDKYLK